MFCPQCATGNADDSKFCRSCGTELEGVALVLKGESAKPSKKSGKKKKKDEPSTAEEWMVARGEYAGGILRGIILMIVSALIAVPLALFAPGEMPWVIIWMVFFGWIAVWGGIETAEGAGGLIEARNRLRLLAAKSGGAATEDSTTPRQLPAARESPSAVSAAEAFRRPAPASVTEGTTRELDELLESRGRARRPPEPRDG